MGKKKTKPPSTAAQAQNGSSVGASAGAAASTSPPGTGTATPASAPSEQGDAERDPEPEPEPGAGSGLAVGAQAPAPNAERRASNAAVADRVVADAEAEAEGEESVPVRKDITAGVRENGSGGAEAGPSSPRGTSKSLADDGVRDGADAPQDGAVTDTSDRIYELENELAVVRGEKEALDGQYRGLLGKLTTMRKSLGEKLREDAEELDRRENTITSLSSQLESLESSHTTLRAELESSASECASLQSQLSALRSQSDTSSSDVLSLTREMRELRGEVERLRDARDEWEAEAGRERARREAAEEDARGAERREREAREAGERAMEDARGERERAGSLQEVLAEFQASKERELHTATSELETQLHSAVLALSEYKLRCANAETRLGEVSGDAGRSAKLERDIKEKERLVAKLRHDAVINNEHLNEALRRLRKSSSESNVDRRLVTNILLAFLGATRGDTKRFEMLGILATILGWDDAEREKAGLQRVGKDGSGAGAGAGGQGKRPQAGRKQSGVREGERSAEEEAAMNESFSNLFVEFLLKEASQGQKRPSQSHAQPSPGSPSGSSSVLGLHSSSQHPHSPRSPRHTLPLPPLGSGAFSPTGTTPGSGASTPNAYASYGAGAGAGYGGGGYRQRTYSQASASASGSALSLVGMGMGMGSGPGSGMMSPPVDGPAYGHGQMGLPVVGRKESWNLRDALGGPGPGPGPGTGQGGGGG